MRLKVIGQKLLKQSILAKNGQILVFKPRTSKGWVILTLQFFRSQITLFFYFLHEVVSPYDLDDHQQIFGRKNFDHQYGQKWSK